MVSRRTQVWAAQQARFQGPGFTSSLDNTADYMQSVQDNQSRIYPVFSISAQDMKVQLKAAEDRQLLFFYIHSKDRSWYFTQKLKSKFFLHKAQNTLVD